MLLGFGSSLVTGATLGFAKFLPRVWPDIKKFNAATLSISESSVDTSSTTASPVENQHRLEVAVGNGSA